MNKLTFNKLHQANKIRQKEFGHGEDWSLTDWGCAIAGETGEMCNLLKKLRRNEPIPKEEVAKEMADVVIYLDLLANKMDIDLGQAIIDKFNEVSNRRGLKTKL